MNEKVKGIWIPKELFKNKNLSWNEKILLIEIDMLCSDSNKCFATNSYFADFLGISKSRISHLISELIKKECLNAEYEYKPNSKEIKKRYLTIIPPCENSYTPIAKNAIPPCENSKGNNIIYNNIDYNNINNLNTSFVKPKADNFSFEIFNLTLEKVFKEDKIDEISLDTVKSIYSEFLNKQVDNCIPVGKISKEAISNAIQLIIEKREYCTEEYMNLYFENKFTKNIDYSINHFLSDGIIGMLDIRINGSSSIYYQS